MAQGGIYEFIKKNGAYIELGAFALAFISVFLPFVNVDTIIGSVGGVSLVSGSTVGGIFIILFVLISAALVGIAKFANYIIENFKKENKIQPKTVDNIVDIGPLCLSIASLIIVIIGVFKAKNEESKAFGLAEASLSVGFYFLLIAFIVAIAVRLYYLICIKEMFKNEPVSEKREVKTEQTNNEVTVQVN